MPAVNPDHLLEQADRLISVSGSGARRQADLRRAISSAYYALFHATATAIADDLVGRAHRASPRYSLVYRTVAHNGLLRLCEEVVKPTLSLKYLRYAPIGGFGTDVVSFANAVIGLQEKRHLADYDPLFRVEASDALSAVATARSALQRFGKASRASRKAFIALALFSPR
jgi:uncharacterized protein (UPF0332 family)